MQAHIIALGKWKKGPESTLFQTYADRIRPKPILKELDVKKRLSGDELKLAEAELILASLPKGAVMVALDERGKDLSSRELAGRIQGWEDQGRSDIAFIIGGADGLHETIRQKCDLLICFGRLTWPHMMVRPMICEQIFRAQAILAGHPYHRD